MTDLDKIIQLCKIIEFRKDYNQSNGGNLSFKNNGLISIKPSGVSIGNLTTLNDFYTGDVDIFNELLKIDEANGDVVQNNFYSNFPKGSLRPSIETTLHTQLYKYTVHIHHIGAMILSCTKDWKKIIPHHFASSLALDYAHPGVELALKLKKELNTVKKIPHVIFMQNHGIIISHDDFHELLGLLEEIDKTLSNLYKYNNYNPEYFKTGEKLIKSGINNLKPSTYQQKIPRNFDDFLTPDIIIHLGQSPRESKKIVIENDFIYIVEEDTYKAKQVDELILAQVEICQQLTTNELSSLTLSAKKRIHSWQLGKDRRE